MRPGLRRDPERGLLGGVLAGLAARLGLDPLLVRVLFGVLVVASGGLAVAAYAIAWALLPGAAPQGRARVRPRARLSVGVGLLTLALLLGFRELGIWWSDALAWPLVLAASGVALLWRQSGAGAEPSPDAAGSAASQRQGSELLRLYRGGFGIALVLGAALLFLSANDVLGGARDAAITLVVVVVAVSLILAPFLWRLGRKLAEERGERIRTQERAELAAHLHDSVLQTLTLMQKRAGEPQEVAALARRQERELRAWLAGDAGEGAGGFAATLTAAAEAIEDEHRIEIEVVVVGDRELDEGGAAIVAAAREALRNAAKFAGPPVSLYAEVGPGSIEAYVRDRGPGFDPAAVPEERRGLRESIIARMERFGGRAAVRSASSGTEVELRIEEEKR